MEGRKRKTRIGSGSGLQDTKPRDWSASSCPSISRLLRYSSSSFTIARFYILFLPISRLFPALPLLFLLFFSVFSLLTESAILHPRQRAVCRSAPPVFQPSSPTLRANTLRLSATFTPHRSFLVVWASSFSTPACSVDKDRCDRKRRPTSNRRVSNTVERREKSERKREMGRTRRERERILSLLLSLILFLQSTFWTLSLVRTFFLFVTTENYRCIVTPLYSCCATILTDIL